MSKKIPKWLNVRKLKDAADSEIKQNSQLRVNLPIKSHNVISSYKCGTCKLQFTYNDVEPQIKKAARTGSLYVECPKCGGVIEAGKVINVPDPQSIIQRALKIDDKNAPPSRSINTWIDKAIYGKLVDTLGKYIERFGVFNPQLRFQRGIRTEKFPGEPHSAKGAEFTVEFVDNNNTRNRIVIQAGLTSNGDFIYPRTFKTLSGNEYPLTKLAIEDFTSGKLYSPVERHFQLPPLVYKQRDITDFRVISADNQKMVKKAELDETQLNTIISQMNITDPNDIVAMKNLLGKYYDPSNPQQSAALSTPVPAITTAGKKLNLNTVARGSHIFLTDWFDKQALPEVIALVNRGLAYNDAYDEAYKIFQEKYNITLEQPEWDLLWNSAIDTLHKNPSEIETTALAEKLIKQAEVDIVKNFYKTADEIAKEFDLSELSNEENKTWTDSYINTYNEALDAGEGIVEASMKAEAVADDKLGSNRVKLALRDKQTLVPFVEKNPDYSIAEQSQFSEKRFDVPYEETDGGISDEKDRNYTTMFKGSSVQKEAYISHEGDDYVVHAESGKTLGKHKTKEEAEKQLQAIEISKHKKGSIGGETGFTLTSEGNRAIELLNRNLPYENYDQLALNTVLTWVIGHPHDLASIEDIAVGSGLNIDTLRNTFGEAITGGLINVPTTGATQKITKQAMYQLTPSGEVALDMLSKGQQLNGFDAASLQTVLSFVLTDPTITKEGLMTLISAGGPTPYQLNIALDQAVTRGYVEEIPMNMRASKLNLRKVAEPTGIDLDSEEVGQNPINYSRLKQVVEDLLRAGNIPPTKVDMHALKDGKYSLKELRDLIDAFKVKKDTFYPTTHASFDKDEIVKLAEAKVSDIVKEMPMERVEDKPEEFSETPLEKGLEGATVETPLEEAVEELVKDEYKGGLEYHELSENPKLPPPDVEMAISHEKDERSHATDLLDLMDRLREEAQKKVDKESKNFQVGINKTADGLVDPLGRPLRSAEPIPEVTPEFVPEAPKTEFVKEPSFRQRSVDVSTLPEAAREATPEEKELFQTLEITKLELEKADTEIQLLRKILQDRVQKETTEYEKGTVAPMLKGRQELYTKLLTATDKLAGLLRQSQNKYIDIDSRYKAALIQRVTSHTTPLNWQHVVNAIKEKAPELKPLIDEIVNGMKAINRTEKQIEQLEFWPAKVKKSADEGSLVNYLATLYQSVYNNLSGLLNTLTNIDQELATATL